MTARLPAILALLCLAACAQPISPAPNAPPTSIGPNSNRQPQSPNSLPPAFQTVNPITPRTGEVGVTQILR